MAYGDFFADLGYGIFGSPDQTLGAMKARAQAAKLREQNPPPLLPTPEPPQPAPQPAAAAPTVQDELRDPHDYDSAPPHDLTSIPTQGPGNARAPVQRRPPPAPTPTPGAAAAPAAPAQAPGGMTPAMLRQQAYETARQANEAATTMPDMSEQAARYRRGYEGAGADIGVGLFLQGVGGKGGGEFGGQILKNALARRQPQQTAYGTIDETGFTADPLKQREFQVQRLEKHAQLMETMAKDAGNEEDRARAHAEAERAHRMAEQIRLDTLRMHGATIGETARHNRALEEQGHYLPIKDADGTVSAVLDTKKGTIVDRGAGGAPGAPGQERLPKLNDSQGKAVAFGMRAAEAAQQLESLGTNYSTSSVATKGGLERLPKVGGVLSSAYNFAMGPQEQMAEQAQRNFVNAVLRRESGAVINPEEFANARQQYFPQPGDSPELLAQKKQNRETAIRGLMIESGPGARFVNEKNVPAPAQPSKLPRTKAGRDAQGYLDAAGG